MQSSRVYFTFNTKRWSGSSGEGSLRHCSQSATSCPLVFIDLPDLLLETKHLVTWYSSANERRVERKPPLSNEKLSVEKHERNLCSNARIVMFPSSNRLFDDYSVKLNSFVHTLSLNDVKFSVCYTNNTFNCSKLALTRLNIENEIMIGRREIQWGRMKL